MELGGVVGLVIGLAVMVGGLYYFITNYEDPPLWWPNFARPDWDKDPENFADLETIETGHEGEGENDSFTGVVGGGGKYSAAS